MPRRSRCAARLVVPCRHPPRRVRLWKRELITRVIALAIEEEHLHSSGGAARKLVKLIARRSSARIRPADCIQGCHFFRISDEIADSVPWFGNYFELPTILGARFDSGASTVYKRAGQWVTRFLASSSLHRNRRIFERSGSGEARKREIVGYSKKTAEKTVPGAKEAVPMPPPTRLLPEWRNARPRSWAAPLIWVVAAERASSSPSEVVQGQPKGDTPSFGLLQLKRRSLPCRQGTAQGGYPLWAVLGRRPLGFWSMGGATRGDRARWANAGMPHSAADYNLRKALCSPRSDRDYFEAPARSAAWWSSACLPFHHAAHDVAAGRCDKRGHEPSPQS